MSIYLDYNASAPINGKVLDYMISIYKDYIGNADSRTHEFGEQAKNIVDKSRDNVADLLGIKSSEVYFTSGATESNNIAIQGLKDYAEKTGKKHIITTSIEHKAVLETVKYMASIGFNVDIVNPGRNGRILASDIIGKLRDDTLLVSVMHVNNETGIIQPVDEIGEELSKRNIMFHVDATQSCGKLVDEIRHMKYSMLSFSAHKFGGPQGIGVLVLRKNGYKELPVKSIMYGGQQERGIRPGTIPVALVAACGEACRIINSSYKENNIKLKTIKDKFIELLDNSGIKYSFNGDQKYCLNNTANICIEGVNSEALMLSTKQYCSISNGSACTSKSYSPSYVLKAMGLTDEQADNSVRISWGPETDTKMFQTEFAEFLSIAGNLVF